MPMLGIDLFQNRKDAFLCIKEHEKRFYLEIEEEIKLEWLQQESFQFWNQQKSPSVPDFSNSLGLSSAAHLQTAIQKGGIAALFRFLHF